jgi:alpha-1,2-mannosyltransferase
MKVRKPSLTARQLVTLVVLLSGTLAIMGLSWYTTKRVPHNNWLFTGHYACSFCDINSRMNDVLTVKHGGVLYSFYDHHQYFTYPTAALFLFWPLSWVSHFWAVTGWSFITIASYAGLLMLGWHRVRGPLTWRSAGVALWATALGVTIFPTMAICLSQGQTASILAIVVALDYLAIRGRAQGVLTGIAAAIKIYPLIFIGVWIARRQWRQAITALASGAITTALAWVLWPKHSTTFFFHRLTSGREISHFHENIHWRSSSSSPYSFFYRPPFDGGSWESSAGLLACLAVAVFGIWIGVRLWNRGYHLTSFVAVLIGSTLSAPVVWDHYFAWVLLLPLVAYEVGWRRPTAWMALIALAALMVPWGIMRDENFSYVGFTPMTVALFFVRNALLLSSLGILIFAARLKPKDELVAS